MIVKGFDIIGRIESKTVGDRLYELTKPVSILIRTDTGSIRVTLLQGFETDGRSGGRFIDWLFPNWGNQRQRACVAVHDALFYDFGISFETANEILRQMIELVPMSSIRAWLVYKGVMTDIARKRFGNNTPREEENKKLAKVEWSHV